MLKQSASIVAISLSIITSCVPITYHGEGSRGAGHDNEKSEGIFANLFKGKSVGLDGKALEIEKFTLLGANGNWPAHLSTIAKKEILSHPNLINGIAGKENPLKGICNNFLDLSVPDRINVLVKVAPALSYGESHFGIKGDGGESSSYRRSYGPFQISKSAQKWGCWPSGYEPLNWEAGIDCAYKIMDGLYTRRGLPIANNETYWSVLRPNNKLIERFMPTFTKLTPECNATFASRPTKNFPGAEIVRPRSKVDNAV